MTSEPWPNSRRSTQTSSERESRWQTSPSTVKIPMQLMHSFNKQSNDTYTTGCVWGVGGWGSAVCFNAHNITMNNKRTATPLTVSLMGQHLQWRNKGFQVNGAQHPVTPGNYSQTSKHSLTLKIQATCRLKTNIIMSKSCCTQMHNFQTGP